MSLISCPLELEVHHALTAAGIAFTHESDGDPINQRLDFHLTDFNIHIEVKGGHSPRIADQMSRSPNVIALQGVQAVALFVAMLGKCIDLPIYPEHL